MSKTQPMKESPEQIPTDLLRDTSLDRRFAEVIESDEKNKVIISLSFKVVDDFSDWVIKVVMNHEVVDVTTHGDELKVNYVQLDGKPPFYAANTWITPNGLTQSEATQFGIPEDKRDLLNSGLGFLRKNAAPPEIDDGEIQVPPRIYSLDVIFYQLKLADETDGSNLAYDVYGP